MKNEMKIVDGKLEVTETKEVVTLLTKEDLEQQKAITEKIIATQQERLRLVNEKLAFFEV